MGNLQQSAHLMSKAPILLGKSTGNNSKEYSVCLLVFLSQDDALNLLFRHSLDWFLSQDITF